MLVFYDAKTGEEVSRWNEPLSRKAFFIHGTTSDNKRWNNYPLAVNELNRIAFDPVVASQVYSSDFKKKFCNFTFEWGNDGWFRHGNNWFLNTVEDRRVASEKLIEHIKRGIGTFEEVVLIGHSHGGNVAIQAADKLFDRIPQIRNVYLLTIGTPAYNSLYIQTTRKNKNFEMVRRIHNLDETIYLYRNCENPACWKNHDRISHIALWNKNDIIDGIALAYDTTICPYSSMDSNSDYFENKYTVNVEFDIKSQENLELYRSKIEPLQEWLEKLKCLENHLIYLKQQGYVVPPLPALLSYRDYNKREMGQKRYKAMEITCAADKTAVSKVYADPFLKARSYSLRSAELESLFVNIYRYYDFLWEIDRARQVVNKPFVLSDYFGDPAIHKVRQEMLNQTEYWELYQLVYALENTSIQTHSFDLANAAEIKKAIDDGRITPFKRVMETGKTGKTGKTKE